MLLACERAHSSHGGTRASCWSGSAGCFSEEVVASVAAVGDVLLTREHDVPHARQVLARGRHRLGEVAGRANAYPLVGVRLHVLLVRQLGSLVLNVILSAECNLLLAFYLPLLERVASLDASLLL